jgi:hypothetical protein
MAPPHVRRPVQHVFGSGTDPRTDRLPELTEQDAMPVCDGTFDQSMAVDTPAFW